MKQWQTFTGTACSTGGILEGGSQEAESRRQETGCRALSCFLPSDSCLLLLAVAGYLPLLIYSRSNLPFGSCKAATVCARLAYTVMGNRLVFLNRRFPSSVRNDPDCWRTD